MVEDGIVERWEEEEGAREGLSIEETHMTHMQFTANDSNHAHPQLPLSPPRSLAPHYRHAGTGYTASPAPGTMDPIPMPLPILHAIHAIRRLVGGATATQQPASTSFELASAVATRSRTVVSADVEVAAHPSCAFRCLQASLWATALRLAVLASSMTRRANRRPRDPAVRRKIVHSRELTETVMELQYSWGGTAAATEKG